MNNHENSKNICYIIDKGVAQMTKRDRIKTHKIYTFEEEEEDYQ